MTNGIFLSVKMRISLPSCSLRPAAASATRTAISVFCSIFSARSTRIEPSSPSSSMPGVSMMTTGPIGSSSIVFRTGSVVVPFISETSARFCPVTAFTRLDFPALRNPKKPICTRSAAGLSFKLIFPSEYILTVLKSEPEISPVGRTNVCNMLPCKFADLLVGNLFNFT